MVETMTPNKHFKINWPLNEYDETSSYFLQLSQNMTTDRFSIFRKVASTSPSCLEALAGFFRLSMKVKFDVYLQWPFGEKLISIL